MKIKKLAVIVQTGEGEVYQVALGNDMLDYLANDLSKYFKGRVIKVTNKLEGVIIKDFDENS